ncbi:MAG: TlyA family RNA methyltransferase [Campylobacteraceae bacterium]|nr:TlyA family RNA methyltransferase [Campylobacteraceae bacterium]
MRLDLHVSSLKNISRNKASELIKKGEVFVNKKCILKPSFLIEEKDKIDIKNAEVYVSRAGEKLAGFLREYNLDIQNKTCLDIGSSTGGFVQVLLQNGAQKVVAVDVGSEQLHVDLKSSPKVELHEQTDIREFDTKEDFDIITCDVSFIAFKDIVKSIDKFAKKDIIILFKPQFEVGRGVKRNKKGVVCDKKAVANAVNEFLTLARKYWELEYFADSTLRGKEGNLESFYAFKKR